MSRTYVATEVALGRRVVVKVLAPELLAGISVERFRREVLLAAQLQHPHVVPVLTAGEMDGVPWFTMPYVEGESLRRRLAGGALPISEAITIMRDVARALAYAHERGVVHRDIKPDNVLLSSGTATVTDFGIAKAINAARTDSGTGATLTQVGTSIGTPAYMAPEQALGDTDTDHRADLYAFGVMAYELLTGATPFRGDNPGKLLAAHMNETPEHLLVRRPDCPERLAALVMHCLAKAPGERPQRAAELVRHLETITSTDAVLTAPAILRGGRIPAGKAIGWWAAAAVGVIVTAWAATEVIGLPDWVLPGAVGVMLAGLPVIAFTAYAQRAAHRAYTVTPGGAAAGAPGTLATLAIKASPHLSWRRAWLGGTIAVGGFAALVIGFMILRALGIGPMGTLRGKGALGDRETLVVADFRGPAADPELGPTVAEALRTDLGQSKVFHVLTRATLRDMLALMQRAAEPVVGFELAREIATREGAKAVLDGEVVRLGQGYVISARLVSALDGVEQLVFRQEAANEDALLAALGRLSRNVRERAGESLRTIRASYQLERVTTSSLAALRKYVEGSRIYAEEMDTERAMAELEEAVRLDTAFAMAWRRLAAVYGVSVSHREREVRALATAYRHRDRLTEAERLLTEGTYFTTGPEPNYDRALAAYEQILRVDSTHVAALNNAAGLYSAKGDEERAERMYRQLVLLPNSSSGTFTNLMQVQIINGRSSTTLDSTVAAFRAKYPESTMLWHAEWLVAWVDEDYARTDSVARVTFQEGRTARNRFLSAAMLGALEGLRGRPRDAMRWTATASDVFHQSSPSALSVLQFASDTASYEWFVARDAARARAAVDRGLARTPMETIAVSERPWSWLLQFAADIGDADLAATAEAGFLRDLLPLESDTAGARHLARAQTLHAAGRWDEAIQHYHRARQTNAVPAKQYLGWVGQAFDGANRPDSAITYLERYFAQQTANPFTVGWHLPRLHRRAGELYEERGDVNQAIAHYARFVNLWREAEPVFQPEVAEVQRRLERLRAGRG